MKSEYPKYVEKLTSWTRTVVAETSDGREITIPTGVFESEVDIRWAPYARIEES